MRYIASNSKTQHRKLCNCMEAHQFLILPIRPHTPCTCTFKCSITQNVATNTPKKHTERIERALEIDVVECVARTFQSVCDFVLLLLLVVFFLLGFHLIHSLRMQVAMIKTINRFGVPLISFRFIRNSICIHYFSLCNTFTEFSLFYTMHFDQMFLILSTQIDIWINQSRSIVSTMKDTHSFDESPFECHLSKMTWSQPNAGRRVNFNNLLSIIFALISNIRSVTLRKYQAWHQDQSVYSDFDSAFQNESQTNLSANVYLYEARKYLHRICRWAVIPKGSDSKITEKN